MVGEDFLGLRGIASELGISSLSVPKKLLRPKGGRMGPGSSLPYVEPLLAFYFFVPHPRRLCFFSAEANRWSLLHPSRRRRYSNHSNRRGWKTKLSGSYDRSTSLGSRPLHNLKLLPQSPHPPPQMEPPGSDRQCKPSQGSFYRHPSPFQQYHSRLCNNFYNLNHQQYSSSKTTCQAPLKQRWVRLGRSLVGSRQTPRRRRSRRRRKTPHYLELVVAVAASLVS